MAFMCTGDSAPRHCPPACACLTPESLACRHWLTSTAVHRLTLTELAPPVAAFSAHALDLAHVFHALPILFAERSLPEIVIIGAEIKKVTGQFSMDLSPRLAKAVEPAVRLIRQELAR